MKASGSPFAVRVREHFEALQSSICDRLEKLDGGKKFTADSWVRDEGGGGLTRVLENGRVFEKGGVNTSAVWGMMPEMPAKRQENPPAHFFATGISLVLHPQSPMVPTVHANLRYFEMSDGESWFGGGTDLTPYYPFDEDIVHFHQTMKTACDRHGPELYPKFKRRCDEYFFLKHRGEARGVGGIFFDELRGDLENRFAFVRDIGDVLMDAYIPLVQRRMSEPWGEKEREWQLLRRGRYVEFNLIEDRGTLFGLQSGGRTESVLMSLPPCVRWGYDFHPEPGTREAGLLELLARPKDWV